MITQKSATKKKGKMTCLVTTKQSFDVNDDILEVKISSSDSEKFKSNFNLIQISVVPFMHGIYDSLNKINNSKKKASVLAKSGCYSQPPGLE